MPENPEVTDKVEGEVFVTHIHAGEETVHVRGIAEPIYLTADLTDSKMIGTGRANVYIERDNDGDLVMSKYEVVPDHVVTPGTVPAYTPRRAATVRLTLAIQEFIDTHYPEGVPWQPPKEGEVPSKQDINAYLDLWLAIHGDEGTSGMVLADTDVGVFDWQVVREARRQLGMATGYGERRAGQILDALLEGAPDAEVDPGELVNREGGLMENVVYHATQIAADRFNPDPADPGWNAEMQEDLLRDACLAYTMTFLTRRQHGQG